MWISTRGMLLTVLLALVTTRVSWSKRTTNVFSSRRTARPRIVGGVAASEGEFPWFAIVAFEESPGVFLLCGGALIHEDLVLTAAHCNATDLMNAGIVLVGANSLPSSIPLSRVIQAVPHPHHNSHTFENDVMILKLDQPLASVPLAVLNRNPSHPGQQANETLTVMGYGETTEGGGVYSDVLQKVDLTYAPPLVCLEQQAPLPPNLYRPFQMMCAGVPQGGRDACQGDSGSPLVDSDGIVVGLTSYGEGCGRPGQYGTYTRVDAYSDWIQSQICILSDSNDCTSTMEPTVDNPALVTLRIRYHLTPQAVTWRLAKKMQDTVEIVDQYVVGSFLNDVQFSLQSYEYDLEQGQVYQLEVYDVSGGRGTFGGPGLPSVSIVQELENATQLELASIERDFGYYADMIEFQVFPPPPTIPAPTPAPTPSPTQGYVRKRRRRKRIFWRKSNKRRSRRGGSW